MFFSRTSPIRYIEPLFRPPSEAHSLIFQVTNGCSWNKCTYCHMYMHPQKRFHVKPEEEVRQEIEWAGRMLPGIRRVFLADGDAIALSTERLLTILNLIRAHLPDVNRISSYCSSRNVTRKSVDELKSLHAAGLKLVYLGAESGDDHVLHCVAKGDTFETARDALNKLGEAGIKRSVMLINGLGGTRFSEQHALNSARLVNATQPEFLANLVMNLPHGEARIQEGFQGQFQKMSQKELFQEMYQLMDALELKSTIFRSDHASNQLVLRGTLNRDKDRLMTQIRQAIEEPERAPLRPEWIRPF